MIPELDYAFYVWSSYALFAVVIGWQFLQPLLRRRRILAELREELALKTGKYDDPNA
ncbi:heme exporter protein CcmD [Wenzhouxiangella sp. XN201]|uniref:heme exporter protein CcmD n=1 Tax=Wenzhouxiangella sp. XN201 TaxID=2710755 RepID=UPI0013C59E88|nr:heme exporter protein CcmD [Wenzhouxiangella sp. XN201]NEZ03611.1 heme exporter protein CcmD [Wenzhouxiangella sp. XN201]